MQPTADGPAIFGIPVDFILFGLTQLGVALFHPRDHAPARTS